MKSEDLILVAALGLLAWVVLGQKAAPDARLISTGRSPDAVLSGAADRGSVIVPPQTDAGMIMNMDAWLNGQGMVSV